jgi:hypothetical protein
LNAFVKKKKILHFVEAKELDAYKFVEPSLIVENIFVKEDVMKENANLALEIRKD